MAGLLNFTPAFYSTIAATGVSAAYAIPGAGTAATLLISNLGTPAFVLLSSSNATVVTPNTGMVVLPYTPLALAIGANTFISVISGAGAQLNLAAGT